MSNSVRREVVEAARTIVIKIGTNVLSRKDDSLDVELIHSIAEQVHRIRKRGRRAVIVSSGAVGAGMGLLGLTKRPSDLPHLQAAAATGQAHLIRTYDEAFQEHGYHAAQMLLTANDFRSRERYLNVRNTLTTLFEYGVVPIINENDTVSVSEVKFGDNDQLAAMVTNLLDRPLLVILSNVDGLFRGDPSDPKSERISQVDHCDESMMALAVDRKSARGTGGMQSKLQSIGKATAVGESVFIANGTTPRILDQILAGDDVGTLFTATGTLLPAWKRWIGYTVQPKGALTIDSGAVAAIHSNGTSLLPIGIVNVVGDFDGGEIVSILNGSGAQIARGITNYSAETTRKIARLRTEEIETVLQGAPFTEVIHRDNLCLTP